MEEKMKAPLLTCDDCLKDSKTMEYEDKLLILAPSSLSQDYRYGEYQYFYAKAGFGCYPDKLGTKVFGKFLIDEERCQFRRNEFLGIADDEKLPEWAKEKLAEIKAKELEQANKAQKQITQSMN